MRAYSCQNKRFNAFHGYGFEVPVAALQQRPLQDQGILGCLVMPSVMRLKDWRHRSRPASAGHPSRPKFVESIESGRKTV